MQQRKKKVFCGGFELYYYNGIYHFQRLWKYHNCYHGYSKQGWHLSRLKYFIPDRPP